MKGVFLDSDSIAQERLDLGKLNDLPIEWTFYPQTTPEQRQERIGDAEIVLTNKVPMDAEIMEACPNLKLIAVVATGTNVIDLEAAKKYNVGVANVGGYGSYAVAQHTMALLLALAANVQRYSDDVRAGKWAEQDQFCLLDYPMYELKGKKLVIVGYGEIGQSVAHMAEAFGMEILVASSRPNQDSFGIVDRRPLEELLPIADAITFHCPLTPATQNLIDTPQLKAMKNSALIINTARGGLVNEAALAQALKDGEIGGAGIDVITVEPPKAGNPLIDSEIKNLILTPHCAWGPDETRQRLLNEVVLNVEAFLNGESRNRLD
jgi:glycerate dehydrogenase